MKRILYLLILLGLFIAVGVNSGQLRLGKIGEYFTSTQSPITNPGEKIKIIPEESVVTNVVETVSPSAVTISISRSRSVGSIFEIDPFDPFGSLRRPQTPQKTQQDIGSGFIVSADGLIVTNKHVVSDTGAKYKIVTFDDKTYDAVKVYRDPVNDLAIIKINASGLKPVRLGDSSKIKVGQMAIAIGTALGEFRNTVTVGVISGVGRGITAGSPFEGYVERLDNVIQTDAAINPGNSGGPLLASSGEVVGVNVAVSAEGQNIGFALPINVVKESLDQFEKNGGKFERPYLGVRYKMITRDLALLNDVPEGAYVQDVVADSPAEKGGVERDDIITKINGSKITESGTGLAGIIAKAQVGDKISIELWRDGEIKTVQVVIEEFSGE